MKELGRSLYYHRAGTLAAVTILMMRARIKLNPGGGDIQ
jgi:hypothetical protein